MTDPRDHLFLPARPAPSVPDGATGDGHGESLHVDTCGTRCPVPILRLRKSVGRSTPGQVLVLTTDDPTAFSDILRVLPSLPVQFLSTRREDERMVFTLLRR